MKKAVFFDIDGTLIHFSEGVSEITPRVKQAVRDLKANGVEVWIATGRPYGFLPEQILELDFDVFVLANGTQIVYEGKTIYKAPLDKSFVLEMIEVFEQNQIQYILEGDHYCYMKTEFKKCGDFYESIGVKREMLIGDYDIHEIDVYKIELVCPNEGVMQKCLNLLEQHPEYDNFHSMTYLILELYSKKYSKATAIQEVLRMLDIPWSQSYAFGDGKNDIEMLQAVGTGIAMGNASYEVKAHADHVVDSVQEDGVAQGVYQYILNQKIY